MGVGGQLAEKEQGNLQGATAAMYWFIPHSPRKMLLGCLLKFLVLYFFNFDDQLNIYLQGCKLSYIKLFKLKTNLILSLRVSETLSVKSFAGLLQELLGSMELLLINFIADYYISASKKKNGPLLTPIQKCISQMYSYSWSQSIIDDMQ